MTTEKMLKALTADGYEIKKALSDYYYCEKNKEDGTTELVWMDSACEDAYDYDSAIAMAYSIVYE